jgi:hypothetical protein
VRKGGRVPGDLADGTAGLLEEQRRVAIRMRPEAVDESPVCSSCPLQIALWLS